MGNNKTTLNSGTYTQTGTDYPSTHRGEWGWVVGRKESGRPKVRRNEGRNEERRASAGIVRVLICLFGGRI